MDIDSIESGKINIKVLTTNSTSITVLTEERFKGKVIQPEASGNRALSEHGLSMLITLTNNDDKHVIMMDTGGLAGTVNHNAKQFGIDLHDVDKLILTHGHFDHFGGLNDVIPLLKEGCEFYLSPHAYLQFYSAVAKSGQEISIENLPEFIKKKKDLFRINKKLPQLKKNIVQSLLKDNNIKLLEVNKPVKLGEGIITSGEIELFDPDEVTKGLYIMKSKKEFEQNTFRDEISIYINVKDKGLVVITGCGHCGIMNTIKHGKKITGIDKIYAVIGGFHEEWNPKEKIQFF
ncbi:MAG: MBL fold metallo-hydrolase [Candidatus Lokiarchaeota archaeon]